MCRSSNASTASLVSEDDIASSISHDTGSDYVFATKPVHPSLPSFDISLAKTKIVALADSGGTVNLMSSETFYSLPVKQTLEQTGTDVF